MYLSIEKKRHGPETKRTSFLNYMRYDILFNIINKKCIVCEIQSVRKSGLLLCQYQLCNLKYNQSCPVRPFDFQPGTIKTDQQKTTCS